jgi:hypothetical protein
MSIASSNLWQGRALHGALLIFAVWALSVWMALFVTPHTGYNSINELFYYSIYNITVGFFVSFYLLDSSKGKLLRVVSGSCSAIILGTLVNESVVDPAIFGSETMNWEGIYYGVYDSLWATLILILLRLGAGQRTHWRHDHSAPERERDSRSDAVFLPADADAASLLVKIARESRRIYARDILYMEAARDFTRVICTDEEHFVSENLKSVLKRAGSFGIVRVHKSFAVNLHRVERLTRTEVRLRDRRVPVGRRYQTALAETWRTRSAVLARR